MKVKLKILEFVNLDSYVLSVGFLTMSIACLRNIYFASCRYFYCCCFFPTSDIFYVAFFRYGPKSLPSYPNALGQEGKLFGPWTVGNK